MARKGPAPKNPARRQRRNKVPENVVQMPGTGKAKPPAAPAGLLPVTRAQWLKFWRSDAAARVAPEHLPALVQLFRDRDMRERLSKLVLEHPLVKGSQGQDVENPMWKRLDALDKRIDRAVIEFGLTPLAAQKFTGTPGSMSTSMSDLNRQLGEALGRHAGAPDPRETEDEAAAD